MPKIVRKGVTCIYQSSFQPEFDLDQLLADYFEITAPVLGVENIRGHSFHRTGLFVLIADSPLKDINEFRILRQRFAKRKFVFIWSGLRTYMDAATEKVGLRPIFVENKKKPPLEAITDLIEETLSKETLPFDKRAKPMLAADLASRVDIAANAIADLRINSVGHIVDDLRSISKDLQGFGKTAYINDNVIQDARDPIKEILKAIASIFDYIENSRTASMVVAGCVSVLVGGGGWSSATCFALSLASWNGKDAFLATIARLAPLNKADKSKEHL